MAHTHEQCGTQQVLFCARKLRQIPNSGSQKFEVHVGHTKNLKTLDSLAIRRMRLLKTTIPPKIKIFQTWRAHQIGLTKYAHNEETDWWMSWGSASQDMTPDKIDSCGVFAQ
jgi:hypothetical protein